MIDNQTIKFIGWIIAWTLGIPIGFLLGIWLRKGDSDDGEA